MDIKELQLVLTVAHEMNFLRAAEKLFVSQPTLSQTVSRVERKLNCLLFRRMPHGLSLTREGEQFISVASNIPELESHMDTDIRKVVNGQAGQIRFGASNFISAMLLTKVLPRFSASHPNIRVIVHNESSAVLERMLLAGELDMAVVVTRTRHPELEYKVLFYEQVLLAIAWENKLCVLGEIHSGDEFPYLAPHLLADQSFILSSPGMRLRQSAEDFFMAQRMNPKIAVTTASIETANRLAAYGTGIAFIPYTYAIDKCAALRPRYFSTDATLSDWTVTVARRRGDKRTNMDGIIDPFVNVLFEIV